MKEDQSIALAFCDPKNITVGKARVIWAKAIQYGPAEGWALPGGGRTANFAEAHACAARMDALMTEMGV